MKEKELVNKILKELNKIVPDNYNVNQLLWIFSAIYFITNKYESQIKNILGTEYVQAEQKLKQHKKEDLIAYYQQGTCTMPIRNLIHSCHLSQHITPLIVWYIDNKNDVDLFIQTVKRKIGVYIPPQFLWSNIRGIKNVYTTNLLIAESSYTINSELGINIVIDSGIMIRLHKYIPDIVLVVDNHLSSIEHTDTFWSSYFAVIEDMAYPTINTIYDCVNTLISQIIASEVQDNNLATDSILDFACGTGSTLISTIKEVEQKGNRINHIYAQDRNVNSCNMTRLNMLINNFNNRADVFNKDVIKDVLDECPVCDIVVSDIPFSQSWQHQIKHTTDVRFKDYGLPPQSTADGVFLLHGLYHLSKQGVMCTPVATGLLFRGGAEYSIRRKLIEDNNIEAIIQLSGMLYTHTGIPPVLIILKKHRTTTDILFINANKHVEIVKRGWQNNMNSKHIAAVLDAYRNKKDIDNFSRVVTLEEIIEEDYNLNVSRYVSTAEEDIVIHLDNNTKELAILDKEIKKAVKEHNKFCKRLKLIGVI